MAKKTARTGNGHGEGATGLPFREFFHTEAFGGVLLLIATLTALLWANGPWAASYRAVFSSPVTVGAGPFLLVKPLLLWINDGLMAVFFFVVGLEIKREILVGELASPSKALLPIAGALGGMAAPALLYAALARSGPEAAGWGIPMATDIAFALGVLALLGDRVPPSLKVFLAALAIVDDMGAVLVIAIFYSHGVALSYLSAGLALLLALAAAGALGLRRTSFFLGTGVVVWFCFLKSGIHPTVAGVLLAVTIPARVKAEGGTFLDRARKSLGKFASETGGGALLTPGQHGALLELQEAAEAASSPLQRLEHALHPWVTFAIMPLFALANAGVRLDLGDPSGLWGPVTAGAALGLLLGKPVGVLLGAYAVVRPGLCAMPQGATWRTLAGVGCLAGIGFTMALFIAALAFGDGPLLTQAKVGILGASTVAGAAGALLLRRS
ncbi:MAG: Na+/H+ antiporter NhaA [Acidobacteriota bacterium]